MKEQQEILIKIVLDAWYSHVTRVSKLLDELTDEQLENEVAPGKNRGIYLVGHLAAVNDRLLPLLGFGKQAHPESDDIFLTSPDKSGKEMPAIADLRLQWTESCAALAKHFGNMQPGEWLHKHTSVSEEDFAKEPHRNKLNVLVGRTNHLSYHFGQLILLKK